MQEKISRRAVLAALGGLGGVSAGSYYYFGRGDSMVRLWLIRLTNYGPEVSVDLEVLKDGDVVLEDTYDLPNIRDGINPYLRDYPHRPWDISDVNPRRITPTWEPTEATYRVRYRRSDQPSWDEFTFENVGYEHVALDLTVNLSVDGVIKASTDDLLSESLARQRVENSTLPESPDTGNT